MTKTVPRQGGSYVRQKDGKLKREQWTQAQGQPAAPAPEPEHKASGATAKVKETGNG